MKKEIPWNLIISKLQCRISQEEDELLMTWLSTTENQDVFTELERVWIQVQDTASDYVPDTTYYWEELSKRMNLNHGGGNTIPKKKQKLVTKTFFRYAAVACIALAVSFSFMYIGMRVSQPKKMNFVHNNLAGKSKMTLPDGTVVWLHSKTTLTYNTHYEKTRLVHLNGEAYFDVSPDKDVPFIVETEGMNVVVHGTKFNIESFANSGSTLVSLVEGSVSLETPIEHIYLRPGEMAVFNKQSHNLSIQRSDVTYAASWANEKMVFRNKSLGEICRFLSKWYNVKIHLESGLENQFKYTFILSNEPLEEIVRLMSRINPMTYQFDEENELTILSKPLN